MSDMTIKVGADTSQFNNALRGIQGSVSNLNRSLLALGVGAAAIKISGFGRDLIANSSKAAAQFETLKVQLEVLAGSASKAGSLLDQMTSFGAKTPLELKDIQESAKMLMAFGIEADNVMGILKMLGDVSMGDAQKLLSLSRAFGQMSGAGRATMEDINQMIDAGFNPLTLVAQKTGESMDALRSRVSDGGVSVKEIRKAFEMATGEGGRFNNMLQKISGTTEGKMSNFRDAITQLQQAFGASFNVGLDSVLDKANNLIPSFKDAADKLGTAAANLLTALSEKLPDTLQQIEAAIAEAGGVWNAVKKGLLTVLEDPAIGEAVSKLATYLIPKSVRESSLGKMIGQSIEAIPDMSVNAIGVAIGGKVASSIGSGISNLSKVLPSGARAGAMQMGATTSLVGSNVMAGAALYNQYAVTAAGKTSPAADIIATLAAIKAGIVTGARVGGPVGAVAGGLGAVGYETGFMLARQMGQDTLMDVTADKNYTKSLVAQARDAREDAARKAREAPFDPTKFTGAGLTRIPGIYTPNTSAQYAEMIKQANINTMKESKSKAWGSWYNLAPDWLMGSGKAPWEKKQEEAADYTIAGFKPFLTARAAVGGGMFFTGKETMASIGKITNQYLAKIENNTRNFTPTWN